MPLKWIKVSNRLERSRTPSMWQKTNAGESSAGGKKRWKKRVAAKLGCLIISRDVKCEKLLTMMEGWDADRRVSYGAGKRIGQNTRLGGDSWVEVAHDRLWVPIEGHRPANTWWQLGAHPNYFQLPILDGVLLDRVIRAHKASVKSYHLPLDNNDVIHHLFTTPFTSSCVWVLALLCYQLTNARPIHYSISIMDI